MNYIQPPNKQRYFDKVWALVRRIPSGKVATYGQIAKMIDPPNDVTIEEYRFSSARWVGLAMAASPVDVPWQRVINSQGKISQRAEADKQKKFLEAEGLVFSNDRINLKQYQWTAPAQNIEDKQGQLF